MKTVKVIIEFEMKGDVEDSDSIKESIYDFLEVAIEADELEGCWTVEAVEDEEDYE